MTLLATVYLSAVLVALAIAFVDQAFLPDLVGRHTAWGLARGWQREIAFWNIGLAVIIGAVLRSKNPDSVRAVVTAVVVLSGLLGTNHLLAALSNRNAWLHRVGDRELSRGRWRPDRAMAVATRSSP
jgi:hypothetical protein